MDELRLALELIQRGWIDAGRLQQAKDVSTRERIPLQDALIRKGFLSFDQLAQLAESADVPAEAPAGPPAPFVEEGELASFGPYVLRGRLLQDATGPVYRAAKPGSDREYFVSILPPHDSIKAEAKARVALEHPRLSKAAAFGAVDGRHFCASHYREGLPLRARGPVSADAGLAIARQVSEALRAVHAAGFAHGRLSADAIFVTPAGDAFLLPPVPGRTDFAADWRDLATALRSAVRRPDRAFLNALEALRAGGPPPPPASMRRPWAIPMAGAALLAVVAPIAWLAWPSAASAPASAPAPDAPAENPRARLLDSLLQRNAFDEALALAPQEAGRIEREAAAAFDSLLREIELEAPGARTDRVRIVLERFLARVRGLPALAARVGAELDRVDAAVEAARQAEREARLERDADAQIAVLDRTLRAFEAGSRYAEALELVKSVRSAAAGDNPHLLRRLDERIAALQRRLVEFGARTPNPGPPDDIWAEAQRHMAASRLQEAILALTELAAVEPDRPRAYSARALCLYRLGNSVAAKADAERALRIDEDATARVVLGQVMLERGEAARAAREFDDAIALGAGADAFHGRALARAQLGEFAAALQDLAEEVWRDPAREGTLAVVSLRASLLLRAGRIEEAVGEARRWTELAPTHAEAFSALGMALEGAGRRAEARDAYRRALQNGGPAEFLNEKIRDLAAREEEPPFPGFPPAPPAPPRAEEPKPARDLRAEARRSFEDARRVLAECESRIARPDAMAEELRSIYFEWALPRATGPAQLEALRRWCRERRRRDLEQKLEQVFALVEFVSDKNPEQSRREEARRQRERARQTAEEFLAKRAQEAKERVGELLRFMARAGYAPPAAVERVRDFAVRAGIEAPADLERLAHAGDKAAPEFETRFARMARAVGDRMLEGVDRILAMGEAGVAFDLLQRVLAVDPENPRAHTGLGHVRVDGRWLRRYEAERWGEGLAWHDRWGWTLAREQARYGPEAYYDLEHQTWKPVREWDAMRQNPSAAWKMRSEHFEVTSTAPLETTVELLSSLEAFFMQAFRQYDAYFGVKLVFAVAPERPPHKVRFYRDREQYLQYASPPSPDADGYYSPANRTSYFFAIDGKVPARILQHEITHQILAEYAPTRDAAIAAQPLWMVEGSAVYLEEAFFRGGTLAIGGIDDHSRLREYRSRGGTDPRLRRILALRTPEQWNAGDVLQQYRAAGAAVHFFMNFDGGRYRGDYVEMLRDAYAGKIKPIEHYFGLSERSLDCLMARYYGWE